MKTLDADAIIFACWASDDPYFQQLKINPAFLPMPNRPMLQLVLERVLSLGCREIMVVLDQEQQHYHHILREYLRIAQQATSYKACQLHFCYLQKHQPSGLTELIQYLGNDSTSLVIAAADMLPFNTANMSPSSALCWIDSGFVSWTGWANVTAGQARKICTNVKLRSELEANVLNERTLKRERERQPLSSQDARLLLNSVHRLLQCQATPSVHIGSNCQIASSARLIAPVHIAANTCIGENCQIGPNVFIGQACILGQDCTIQTAFLIANTVLPSNSSISGAICNQLGTIKVYSHETTSAAPQLVKAKLKRRTFFWPADSKFVSYEQPNCSAPRKTVASGIDFVSRNVALPV